MPASLLKSPLAMPYLIAAAMLAPVAPPQAAEGSNAALNISEIASGIW